MISTVLPDIFSLALLILAFRPLVRRVGPRANLWFLGWSLLLLHNLAGLFVSGYAQGSGLANLLALLTLQGCALTFLMASGRATQRVRPVTAWEFGLAMLFETTLFALAPRGSLLPTLAFPLFLLPALHLFIDRKRRSRAALMISLCFASLGVFLLPSAWHNPALVVTGALTILFLGSALIFHLSIENYSRGAVAAVAGLVVWGLSFPILALALKFIPQFTIDPALLKLPQYLVIAGFLLTLLEDYVRRTERMAMHDPLTELPNRRLFEQRLNTTLQEARLQHTTIACLVIDIDNFKKINDTLGHSAGDQLLRALAVRLSWSIGPRDTLARTGGDEFMALLAGVTDEHHLHFIAGSMMSAASVPIVIDGKPVDVRISIGIALSPDDADDMDGLRRAADDAMYTAKRRGGSLLAFASEDKAASGF